MGVGHLGTGLLVALPTEGVDRNQDGEELLCPSCVALPTEGVDRNPNQRVIPDRHAGVALPTEGVDRNLPAASIFVIQDGRPPHGGRG